MRKVLNYLRESVRDRELVLLSIPVAVMFVTYPFQRLIHLSRFQHYSFGVAAIAVGFFLQTLISWRRISWWGRLSLMSCAMYLGAFGYVCYTNPWLDWNFDLETSLQSQQRHTFAAFFAVAGLPIGILWSRWAMERQYQRGRRHEESEPQEKVSS